MTTPAWHTLTRLACPMAAVALLAGCVKRQETITVLPDGSARVEAVFESEDLEDIPNGDALLEDPGPWTVEDQIETDDDGDQSLTRTATLTIPPGGEFPEHFAGSDADLAELALNFTTELWCEHRPDGTYYHFRRVYHRRDWARIDYFRHKYLEEPLKTLEEKDHAELTQQERQDIGDALVAIEGIKTLVLAEAAAEALEPLLPQDQRLAVDRTIRDVFEDIDTARVVELLEMEGEEAEAEIARAVQDVNERLLRAIGQTLDRADRSGTTTAVFMAQFERERQRYLITEDLKDENFEVTVKLPGEIVGYNTFGDADGDGVEWEFEGDALYDRDVVLMATSVVRKR